MSKTNLLENSCKKRLCKQQNIGHNFQIFPLPTYKNHEKFVKKMDKNKNCILGTYFCSLPSPRKLKGQDRIQE